MRRNSREPISPGPLHKGSRDKWVEDTLRRGPREPSTPKTPRRGSKEATTPGTLRQGPRELITPGTPRRESREPVAEMLRGGSGHVRGLEALGVHRAEEVSES